MSHELSVEWVPRHVTVHPLGHPCVGSGEEAMLSEFMGSLNWEPSDPQSILVVATSHSKKILFWESFLPPLNNSLKPGSSRCRWDVLQMLLFLLQRPGSFDLQSPILHPLRFKIRHRGHVLSGALTVTVNRDWHPSQVPWHSWSPLRAITSCSIGVVGLSFSLNCKLCDDTGCYYGFFISPKLPGTK